MKRAPVFSADKARGLRNCKKLLLAVSLATVLGVPIRAAPQDVVLNCLDSGTNSLRDVISHATSGDTIDLTQTHCSPIVLTTEIAIPQAVLTIEGPGAGQLTIDAGLKSRIFNHNSTSVSRSFLLTISGVTLTRGSTNDTDSDAKGGCVRSMHNLTILNSAVTGCTVITRGQHSAQGAGIFTSQNLTLTNSAIDGNAAASVVSTALCGGASVGGDFVSQGSTISNNLATATSKGGSFGGGACVDGHAHINQSTISGNSASDAAGLQLFYGTGYSTTKISTVSNSTFSGNLATYASAIVTNGDLNISNSSIVFNQSSTNGSSAVTTTDRIANYPYAKMDVQSSIIANNGSSASTYDLNNDGPTTGSHNLITSVSADTGLPASAFISTCPFLGPLRDNGGLTKTHALLSGSAGIDGGSNNGGFANDQRGSPYPRISGAATDIGAYEINQADIVFGSGFDGCF